MFSVIFALSTLIALLACEAIWPRRAFPLSRRERWSGAFVLIAVGSVMSRLVLPVGLVGVTVFAQTTGLGLFAIMNAPVWLEIIAAVMVLDLAVWAQHVAMHHNRWLWKLHRVHHSDPGFDATTALRFHPLEFLVSLAWKGGVVLALGASPLSVAIFIVVLNVSAMFNHSNIALPTGVDGILRLFIVTPDMHRVHHSVHRAEANTNFGFFLPWWDRLFRVYKDQPTDGHLDMALGQNEFRSSQNQSALALLKQPFETTQRP